MWWKIDQDKKKNKKEGTKTERLRERRNERKDWINARTKERKVCSWNCWIRCGWGEGCTKLTSRTKPKHNLSRLYHSVMWWYMYGTVCNQDLHVTMTAASSLYVSTPAFKMCTSLIKDPRSSFHMLVNGYWFTPRPCNHNSHLALQINKYSQQTWIWNVPGVRTMTTHQISALLKTNTSLRQWVVFLSTA